MARPATYVAATAVAALTLQIIPLQWSFLVLAVIMMFGALRSLALRDTK
jgi:hypothetical protein